MGNRHRSLRNIGVLAVGILGTLLSAKLWAPIAYFLADTFPKNPALAGTILSIIGAIFFLCVLGARMRPQPVSLVCRAALLFLSVVAAIASMEAISLGSVSVTVTPSREGILWISTAVALIAIAACGLRVALDWRLSYWIVFPAVFATLMVATFGASIVALI